MVSDSPDILDMTLPDFTPPKPDQWLSTPRGSGKSPYSDRQDALAAAVGAMYGNKLFTVMSSDPEVKLKYTSIYKGYTSVLGEIYEVSGVVGTILGKPASEELSETICTQEDYLVGLMLGHTVTCRVAGEEVGASMYEGDVYFHHPEKVRGMMRL